MTLSLPQYPYINGVRPDFSSISFLPMIAGAATIPVVGIKSINYKAEQDPADVFGTSPLPIGQTRGTAKFSGDIEIYLEEFQSIVTAQGPGFTSNLITINIVYSEGIFTTTDTLIGCRLISPEVSQSQGADPLTRKFSLKMLNILFGGNPVMLP